MNYYITPDLRCAFNEGYKEGRTKAIDEVILTLAMSEDTILSDRQYYELLKMKGDAE